MIEEKFITVEYITALCSDSSNTPYELVKELYGSNDNNNYPNFIYKKPNFTIYGDNNLMSIIKLKELIETCEQKGCTHVEIFHHIDHQDYYVYGAVCSKTSEEDKIKFLEEKVNEKKKVILEQILYLQDQLAKIQ